MQCVFFPGPTSETDIRCYLYLNLKGFCRLALWCGQLGTISQPADSSCLSLVFVSQIVEGKNFFSFLTSRHSLHTPTGATGPLSICWLSLTHINSACPQVAASWCNVIKLK